MAFLTLGEQMISGRFLGSRLRPAAVGTGATQSCTRSRVRARAAIPGATSFWTRREDSTARLQAAEGMPAEASYSGFHRRPDQGRGRDRFCIRSVALIVAQPIPL